MSKPNLSKLKNISGERAKSSSGDEMKTQVTLSRFFGFPGGSKRKGNSDDEPGTSCSSNRPRKLRKLEPKSTSKISPSRKPVTQEEGSDPSSSQVSISSVTLTKLTSFAASSTNLENEKKHDEQLARDCESRPTSDEGMAITMETSDENLDAPESLSIKDKLKDVFSVGDKHADRREKSARATRPSKAKTNFTPLEQQYIEIKKNYPHAVLFVECGYKYRFFGEDAEIAAKELNIFCHLDHNFMTASVPVHRLFVHVRRLVSAGYKVGVVKQTETAALKAAGDNKNAPFTRSLSALYTKSTLIGEDVEPSGSTESSVSTCTNYLLCITEMKTKSLKSGQIQIGLMAVQPSTGDIIYDEFVDGTSRSELEMRISHIQPVELLLPMTLSEHTEKLMRTVTASCIKKEDRIRIERMEDQNFHYNSAFQSISDFCNNNDDDYGGGNVNDDSTSQASSPGNKLQQVVNLPKSVLSCYAALIKYLQDFHLEKVLKLTSNVKPFTPGANYMKLNACTLKNLEIFTNDLDGGTKGTLFWMLDHTTTRFGQRLLKKWIAQPLLDKNDIEERREAVSDILSDNPVFSKIKELLSKMPDIEKGLCSIYHKKCSTSEFLSVAKTLLNTSQDIQAIHSMVDDNINSKLLWTILHEIPVFLDDVHNFTNAISHQAAKDGDKTKLFINEMDYPNISKHKEDIEKILQDLNDHRREIKLTLKSSSFDYVTVSGQEFLIEVRNAHLKLVPSDWMKISYTKAVTRFHSPYVMQCYKHLCQLREQLLLDCNEAWLLFLECFSDNYASYRSAVRHLATLDCLYSLAEVAKQEGYCKPVIVGEGGGQIHIQDGRHPIVEVLLGEHEQYVPNVTELGEKDSRCMIITGPNMGGKSSYIKQVALIVIMSQIGCYVPAHSAKLATFDAIFTRMGASDNICHGNSTFMVELQEASEILQQATSASLVVLDELGRGTSTHDGMAIAYATLHHVVSTVKCLTLFVTHYPPLAELEKVFPDEVKNFHMSFLVHDKQEDDDLPGIDIITFLYQLVPGVAQRSYGLNVARLADIPVDILQIAAKKSDQLEDALMAKTKGLNLFQKIWTANIEELKSLVSTIDDK